MQETPIILIQVVQIRNYAKQAISREFLEPRFDIVPGKTGLCHG